VQRRDPPAALERTTDFATVLPMRVVALMHGTLVGAAR
jgi:hypothetical protein